MGKDIQTNPTLIKIREELMNMTIKAIDNIKQKSAVLIKEIQRITSFVTSEVERLIKVIREEGPIMMEKAIKLMSELLAKVQEQIKSTISDVERLVKYLYTK